MLDINKFASFGQLDMETTRHLHFFLMLTQELSYFLHSRMACDVIKSIPLLDRKGGQRVNVHFCNDHFLASIEEEVYFLIHWIVFKFSMKI
jgi:hypothetical protein